MFIKTETSYNDERMSRAISVLEKTTGPFDISTWETCAIGQLFIHDGEYLAQNGLIQEKKIGSGNIPCLRRPGANLFLFEAVAAYFGITENEALYAFNLIGSHMLLRIFGLRRISARDVARHLRGLQKRYRRAILRGRLVVKEKPTKALRTAQIVSDNMVLPTMYIWATTVEHRELETA